MPEVSLRSNLYGDGFELVQKWRRNKCIFSYEKKSKKNYSISGKDYWSMWNQAQESRFKKKKKTNIGIGHAVVCNNVQDVISRYICDVRFITKMVNVVDYSQIVREIGNRFKQVQATHKTPSHQTRSHQSHYALKKYGRTDSRCLRMEWTYQQLFKVCL